MAQLVVFHAYCIGSAEAHALTALATPSGGMNVFARLGGDRRRTRELRDAFATLVPNVGALRVVLEESSPSRARAPGDGAGGAGHALSGVAFVLRDHFVVYLDATGEAMLWDTFGRFVGARAARLGARVPEMWAPEDDGFRVSYNGLVYTALPARALRRAMGAGEVPGGPDSSDGTSSSRSRRRLGAAGSTCRRAWATLGIYAQSEPRAGIEGLAVTPTSSARSTRPT